MNNAEPFVTEVANAEPDSATMIYSQNTAQNTSSEFTIVISGRYTIIFDHTANPVNQRPKQFFFCSIPRPEWPTRELEAGDQVPDWVRMKAIYLLGPALFVWSGGPNLLHLKLPAYVPGDWIEGRDKQLINFDRITGNIRGEITDHPHDNNMNEQSSTSTGEMHDQNDERVNDGEGAVVGAVDTVMEETGSGPASVPDSYDPNEPPFDFFTINGYGPMDTDVDIIWSLVEGRYRAFRLSTGMAEPTVVPNLVTIENAMEVKAKAEEWLNELKRRAG